ncbi:MAG: TIGR00725 family protein [Candidatus Omnitrophota bacterium]
MSRSQRNLILGVIGTSKPNKRLVLIAEEVGREIASHKCLLVCGGLGGVMEYSAKGAKEKGGITIGILPTDNPSTANKYIDIPIVTGLGEARNVILVKTAHALIAIGKGLGTLSEIAFAIKRGKAVIGLSTWELSSQDKEIAAIIPAKTPKEAVEKAIELSNKIA